MDNTNYISNECKDKKTQRKNVKSVQQYKNDNGENCIKSKKLKENELLVNKNECVLQDITDISSKSKKRHIEDIHLINERNVKQKSLDTFEFIESCHKLLKESLGIH